MSERSDLALIRHLDGIYVGLLDGQDLEAFERCCKAGTARRSYEGVAGFLSLAKVRIVGNEDCSDE